MKTKSLYFFAISGLVFQLLLALCSKPSLVSAQTVDITPPQLTSLSITPQSVDTTDGPAQLTLTIGLTDDVSGIATTNFYLNLTSSDGTQSVGFYTLTPVEGQNDVYTSSATMQQYALNGEWKVASFFTFDKAGNFVSFDSIEINAIIGHDVIVINQALTIDTTPPTITCPAPINGTVGQVVNLGTPVVSDIVDAMPTVTNNAPSSFGPGTTDVTWTVTDYSLNHASCTQTVTLRYVWLGFFQPIQNGILNLAKTGSTIPAKWALKDANGNFFSDLTVVKSFTSSNIACSSGQLTDTIETYASGGSVFRYDLTANQYIYNWATLKSWAQSCRRLTLILNDDTIHTADFQFK